MTLRYPGERALKALDRRNGHDARLLALVRLGPKGVYAGLLWVQRDKNHDPGWIGHTFREIFGTWPRPRDKGAPVRPPVELLEWIRMRKKGKAK
jgi:hypothetical protein